MKRSPKVGDNIVKDENVEVKKIVSSPEKILNDTKFLEDNFIFDSGKFHSLIHRIYSSLSMDEINQHINNLNNSLELKEEESYLNARMDKDYLKSVDIKYPFNLELNNGSIIELLINYKEGVLSLENGGNSKFDDSPKETTK